MRREGPESEPATPCLGFDTFRCNVNWQMAIQKKCHMAALHALHTHLNDDVPELRKKIVHLALFRCVRELLETIMLQLGAP